MRLDTRLSQLAGDEMPDARHRLDYVIRMTETAAHRTLDLVEQARVVPTRMMHAAAQLTNASASLRAAPADAAAIRLLLDGVRAALHGDALQLRTTLSELAQAQEYQDITGQLIKRVITLVCNVESALLELLRAAGGGLQAAPARPISALSEPPGPVLPGGANAAAAANQHDADELLASLGF
jgi:chemotaxis protein CheZ